jgi:hypothetical protein
MKGIGNEEPCIWDVLFAGEIDHFVADVNAEAPGESGNNVSQYQAGPTPDIDDAALGTKGPPLLKEGVNLVEEARVSLIFVEVAVGLTKGTVPGVGSGVPARGDFIQNSVLVEVRRILLVRQVDHFFSEKDHS